MKDKSIAIQEMKEAFIWAKHIAALNRGDIKKAEELLNELKEI